jgi:Ni/Fe-hydrogenase subunit HybB-like protein
MHQSSLGTLFVIMSPRLHPLWYSMLLPVFFLISSLAAGISLVLIGSILSRWVFHSTLSDRQLEKLGWLLPWILGLYLSLKLGELLITEELGLLFTSGIYSLLFWAEITIGVILPIVLFSIKKARLSRTWTLAGALLVAGGIALNRFNASWFAIEPVGNVRYSPSWMEIAILVGVFCGVLLVYTVLAQYFPVFAETVCDEDCRTHPHRKIKPDVLHPSTGD